MEVCSVYLSGRINGKIEGMVVIMGKFNELLNKLEEILDNAPEEFECTDKENDLYADMENLKENLENYIG